MFSELLYTFSHNTVQLGGGFALLCLGCFLLSQCLYQVKLIRRLGQPRLVTLPVPATTPTEIEILKETCSKYEVLLKACTGEEFIVIPTFHPDVKIEGQL